MMNQKLQLCENLAATQSHNLLNSFHQALDSILTLLPGDNAEVHDKIRIIMNMLHADSDKTTEMCSCLMVQRNELKRREQLLGAVNFMAVKLVANADWQQCINSILARLGLAAGVDRVYLFQDYQDAAGNLYTKQQAEWVADGIQSQINHAHLRTQSYKASGFERWVDMFKDDIPISGDIDTFPLCEYNILKKQDIFSILAVPIRQQNSVWGFIGFDNCYSHKNWCGVELDVLHTAAKMLGGAISQQQINEEIQEKKQTYQLILDTIKDGYCLVNDQMEIIEGNTVFLEMFQKNKTEIEKVPLWNFIHPDSQQEMNRILSDETTLSEEIKIILSSGKHSFPASVHFSRLEGDNNKKSNTFIFVRDQTSSQRLTAMNAALMESNNRLHDITNLARDGIILFDAQGTIKFWNPASVQIFGYSFDEIMGKNLSQLFYSKRQYQDINKKLIKALSSFATQNNYSHIYEFKALHKNGTYCYIEISFSFRIDAEKSFILGLCRDVSERHEAQQALKKSEMKYLALANKFSALLDAIPDGFIELAADGKMMWANKGALTLFGLKKKTITEDYCPCYSINKTQSPVCLAKKTFKTGKKQQKQFVLDDGRTFDHRSFPLYNEEGIIDSVIVVVRDISKQLHMEATASRNAHLTSLGIMAAGMAHEINNPNNFIMLNAPLVAEAYYDSLAILDMVYQEHSEFYLAGLPYSEFKIKGELLYRGIIDGSRRIAAITNHLREFACQDIRTTCVPVQINDLVYRGVQLVKPQIRKYTNELRLNLAKQLPLVSGNPGQIEQVIVNLLMNAAESLCSETAAIILSTSLDVEKKQVLISVCDEGCGIAPENLQKITQPFYTTKLHSGGSGLGLSVSQSLISQHGGQLDFQSQVGAGTTATVSLPVVNS